MAAGGAKHLFQILPVLRSRFSVSFQVCKRCARLYSTVSQEAATPSKVSKWSLSSAVCLERYPVIIREMSDVEVRYHRMVSELELERSLLSDHEVQMREDEIFKKKMQEGLLEAEEEEAFKEKMALTAFEKEDQWKKEVTTFSPASRITEADRSGDMSTPQRVLDRKLVLIVQQQLGDDLRWILPFAFRDDGESMKDTANKALEKTCGDGLKSIVLGNAPCGYFKYVIPKTQDGVKIFFYKACYKGGDVKISDESVKDHKWVTHEELTTYLKPRYYRKINQFLFE